ncbi:MAG: hypothetical protein ACE5F8_09150 [Woeseiaceae bacterium]
MNKKFLISWVVVFVLWTLGGMLVHGTWLYDDYANLPNIMRTDEAQMGLMHFMIVAHVLLAGAFVWIYQRGTEDKPWLQQGIRFGAAIALLMPIPTFMIYYVVQQMPGMLAVKQSIGDGLVVVVLGVVVAFLNKTEAAKATAPTDAAHA